MVHWSEIDPYRGNVEVRKLWAAGAVAAASVGIVLGGTGVASAASTTIPGMQGVYAVGFDVAPGTYSTEGAVLGAMQPCTWVRAKVTVNGPEPIAVGQFLGPGQVTIESSDDVFITAGCADWTLVSAAGSLDAGSLGAGSLNTGSLAGGVLGSLNNGPAGSLAGSLLGGILGD